MMNRILVLFFSFLSISNASASFENDLVEAALFRTTQQVTYDGAYRSIAYPNGDVPANVGVCSDVVIRSYRSLGIDLQVLVHEDMSEHFSAYPSKHVWGMTRTDKNIDHRRVLNLEVFFKRNGQEFNISNNPKDYKAGDIVSWMLAGNLPHIGIVTDQISITTGNPLIVHNIGKGPELDDMLFTAKITGHFRYKPEVSTVEKSN